MITRTIRVGKPSGQDARPVAVVVQIASQFDSTIHLGGDTKWINAKSIMGMMTLDLSRGTQLQISADGIDEADAVEKLTAYLAAES